MIWERYIGEFVSVLINGKESKEENYLGTIIGIDGDFMVLNTQENFLIDEIIFRVDLIKSIWIYKKRTTEEKKLALRDKYGLGYPKPSKKT